MQYGNVAGTMAGSMAPAARPPVPAAGGASPVGTVSRANDVPRAGGAPCDRPPILPGCTFVGTIGRGGTADVHRYRVDGDERTVAVKVSRTTLDGPARQRMVAEARALAGLGGHPHVLAIHDAGVAEDGRGWLMLAYAPGGSLGDLLARRTLDAAQVADWGVRLAGALAAAHRLGVAHRDIKPANVLIDGGGMPMLADFGVAADVYRSGERTGHSALWAAPEVTDEGRGGDESSDVYALAATLFAAYAGRSPRVCATPEHMPPALARTLGRALSPAADDRPGSAVEFARDLQRAQLGMGCRMTPLVVEGASPYPHDVRSRLDTWNDAQDDAPNGTRDIVRTASPASAPRAQAARVVPSRPSLARPHRCRSRSRSQDRPHGRHAASGRRGPYAAILPMLAMAVTAGTLFAAVAGMTAMRLDRPSVIASFSSVAAADDVVAGERIVPTPDRLSGVIRDGTVTFTWANPDPQEGDSYLWSPVDDADGPQEAAMTQIDATTLTLHGDAASPCVQVSIMRSDRRASARPAVACAVRR
ncbi:serine/threonine protein kinase [Bifidobacterium amazonense]|uniref:non-specific serine/threonine protein kinase n=1 Tax=Bifidobacterium amazonense TaxID=2809027 RepID=A0ABS9VTA4_9BIFI|nr:serine/threonine-protein kinase [Bifidobacterium amazonense]MCH9275289.1 serine/threonine protein kinase [Bifidobacterium amazonense]